jgi:phospholipase/carboxylesterase
MDLPALHAIIQQGPAHGPVIVLLHGRGSDERDLLPLGRILDADATTVSVRAPFDAAPWGYGPGFAWYRFLGGTEPEPVSFEAGQAALAAFIDALPHRLGRAATPFILGGFSQGGVSALAYLMRHPGRVRGVMLFSGFLADHSSVTVTPERVGRTPIFWGHGTADTLVPFELAEEGWATLRAAGAQLESHQYPGMSHTINDGEMSDAAAWVERVLAGTKQDGAP